MKKILPVLVIALVLLTSVQPGQTQGTGPLVIIQGPPDTTTAPPEMRTYVSVIDESTAQAIKGLTAEDFQVQEAGTDVGTPTVSYEPAGLAIVVVVDRGGISAPRDGRIKEATDLVRELVNRLSVTGASDDDVIAIVGVGEDGVLEPEEDFSYDPVDTNLVMNALVAMEGETVSGGTPLYEGLDEALRLLTANTDATIRDVLSQRRKIVVVLSDGLDPNFSDEAREGDITSKARAADISLYTIGMAQRNRGLSAEDNMVRLAHQTHGLYQLHNDDETHEQVLALFDCLVTQRQQYLVTYQTRQPKGDYTLNIAVDTPIGSAEESVTFSSILETPEIALTAPAGGLQVTVPYSRSLKGFVPTPLEFSVQITPVDGAERYPSEVRYIANGEHIGTGTAPPDFPFTWHVSEEMTTTEQIQSKDYTLAANADDAYLGTGMTSQPVNIGVKWEAKEVTGIEGATVEVKENWWVILMLIALAVGLLILLILLIRTRGKMGEMTRQAISSTTGMLKGITKRLGATPQRAPGKLVVIQGTNMGKEFRLATQRIVVGRDPQFCDFALYDDFASNPHFSIQLEQTQFFITDEGSTNGTKLNGTPLPPRQRMLLPPDAIIEMGQTRLQFKRLGGTTRQLGGSQAPAAAPPSPSPAPHPPTRPAPGQPLPPSSPQIAPGGQMPQQQGRPTRIVP